MKLIRSKPVADGPITSEIAGPRFSWKVLVVDDEADIRTLTRLNLKGSALMAASFGLLKRPPHRRLASCCPSMTILPLP